MEHRLQPMLDELVCIGGPCDGQRLHVPHDQRMIEVPVWPAAQHPVEQPLRPYGEPYRLATYRRMSFAAGRLQRDVLVPDGMASEAVLARLIEGYGRVRTTEMAEPCP